MRDIRIIYRKMENNEQCEMFFETARDLVEYMRKVIGEKDPILLVFVGNICIYSALAHTTIYASDLVHFFEEKAGV